MPVSQWSVARVRRRRLRAVRPRLHVLPLEARVVPDVSGTVFRDNNFDGRFTAANDQGFYAGVVVTATNAAGATAAGTTGPTGAYTIATAALGGGPLRVELGIPAGYADAPVGPDSGSSVRFLASGTQAGVNFGVVNPRDYSQAAPDLFTPTYDFGPVSPASTAPALYSFPYTADGTPFRSPQVGANPVAPTVLARVGQIGTTYGLAYKRDTQTIFAGAFLRRYSGSAAGGLGAIYRIDRAGGAVSTLLDLNNLPAGQPLGGSTAAQFAVGTDAPRAVPGYDWSADTFGLNNTHRLGLGDVDISEDGRTLYAVNLRTRELLEIPLTAAGGLDAARPLRRTPAPLTTGNDPLNFNRPQDVRPFALSVHDGVVFVGSTYTAETSGDRTQLRSYVFAFDPAAGQFRGFDQRTNRFTAGAVAPVLTADLSYARLNGNLATDTIYDVNSTATPAATTNSAGESDRGRNDSWRAWDNLIRDPGGDGFRRHQPLLTDLEFDRGVMILGLRDRHGDKVGWFGANPAIDDSGAGEGDTLRAHPDGAGGFALESGGVSNGVTNSIGGAGSGNATLQPQGPGGARFYWSQYLYEQDIDGERYGFAHSFLGMGGLFQVPGGTRLATTIMDPVRYSTGGVAWLDNATGGRPQNYELYADGDLGKANGLGDLQGFTDPAPLEFGNRVWRDANSDGVQSPGEAGIGGVVVTLVDAGTGTTLATATTAADGTYSFSGFAGTSTADRRYGLNIRPGAAYRIVIPNATGASQQAALAGLRLTTAGVGGATTDSDATSAGTNAVIAFTAGGAGENDFTRDAGFVLATAPDVGVVKTTTTPAVNAGEAVAFTLVVSNAGSADAVGVTLTDPLPAGGSAWAIDPSTGDPSAFVLTTAGGVQTLTLAANTTLPVGSSLTVRLTATAGPSAAPFTVTLTNTATVAAPGDTNPANDQSQADITVRSPDVTVTKTADAPAVSAGEAVGFTVRVANAGAGTAFGVTLDDPLPDLGGGNLWSIAGPANGFVLSTTGGIQRLSLAPGTTLAAGASVSVRVVGVSTVAVLDLPNTATAAATNEAPGATGNNTGTATLTVRTPDVTATKTAEAASVSAGGLVAFRVTVANAGTGLAQGVTLNDPLPALGGGNLWAIDPAFGDAAAFQLVGTSPQVLRLAGAPDLAAGATLRVRVTAATVPTGSPFTQTLPNTATTGATNEPPAAGGNNTATASVTVLSPDVAVTKTSDRAGVTAGEAVGFTVTVSNAGPGPATGVVLNDPLPALGGTNRWTLDTSSPDAAAFLLTGAAGSQTLTLAGSPSLAPGRSLRVRVVGVSTAQFAGLANTATVGAGNEAPAAGGNNAATSTVTVGTLSLGDLVFRDDNNDGLRTAGEPGIAGVVVVLLDAANTPLRTATTDSSGLYQFGGLPQGDYRVRVTPPVGFASSTGTNGSPSGPYEPANGPFTPAANSSDHGTTEAAGTVVSGVVTLTPVGTNPDLAGAGNLSVDFGLFPVLSVGDFVWTDADNDGRLDPAEAGVGGVLVTLLSAAGVTVATATTNPQGGYLFSYLVPGNYQVAIPVSNFAAGGPLTGLTSSTGLNGSRTGPSEPAAGTAGDNQDHGSGLFAGVVGQPLTLSVGGGPLGESPTPGGIPDPATDANGDRTQDFGFFRPLAIGDRVFEDVNNDGLRDGETGLGGVRVELLDAAGATVATTTTGGVGLYRFDFLTPGEYTVRVVAPAGFRSSTGTRYDPVNGPFESGLVVNTTNDDEDHGRTTGGDPLTGVRVAALRLALDPAGNPDEGGYANLRQDFGLYRAYSLGNVVWNDANNDGRRQPGEAGLAAVTVRLLDASGATVGTTTTDANGFYRFDDLPEGRYVAQVDRASPALAGLVSSTGGVGGSGPFEPAPRPTADSTDAGTTTGGFVSSAVIPLGPGDTPTGETDLGPGGQGTLDAQADLTVDFGFFRPLTLGNQVWEDANNNGVLDPGEPGLGNVPVRLLDAARATLATATTDAGGRYLFTGLAAGTYTVQVDPTAPALAGYGSSTGAVGPGNTLDGRDNGTPAGGVVTSSPVPLTADTLTVDFGFFRGLSLGNLVWEDANNDGKRQAAEPGLGGLAVTLLDAAGATVGVATTSAAGHYLFTGLGAGQYRVAVAAPAGYVTSSGSNGRLAGPYEPGVSGPRDDEDHGTLTAGRVVSGLVTLAAGTAPTGEPATPGLPDPAADANSDATVDFGLFHPLAVGNLVFVDRNNNGVRDAGEPGLGGIAVTLLDAAGATVGTTTTASDGGYRFDALVPGTYVVRINPPAGVVSSTGRVGSPTGPVEPVPGNPAADDTDHGTAVAGGIATNPLTLTAAGTNPDENGLANLRQDFGLFQPLSLGNLVWEDANNNGRRDVGEPGLGGVTVTLLDAAGATVAVATTTADGGYLFTNLVPGGYTVRVAPPAGYVTSSGTNGSANGPYEPGVGGTHNNEDHGTATAGGVASSVTLTAAGSNPDLDANLRQDFGLYRPLSVGNQVWQDTNNNGRLDAGEPAVAGVPVRLLDAAGSVIATATTGADGRYLFPLLTPGTYTVQITPPTGFLPSTPTSPPVNTFDNSNVGVAGPNGVIQSPPFRLIGDVSTVDFGLLGLGGLSGRVFVDNNLSGTFDSGDRPLGGMIVTLDGPAGPRTATTDATGQYAFTGLPPGTYTVSERQPGGILLDSVDTPGSLGGGSPSNDRLQTVVRPNDAGTGYDFAEVAPARLFGTVFADLNRSGGFDAGDAGIPGVPVTVSGTAFAGTPQVRPLTAADVPGGLTALTGLGGRYEFPVLPPGEYTVTQGSLPASSAAVLADSRDYSGDPAVSAASVGRNVFTDVPAPAGSARGPLVFAWVPSSGTPAGGPADPTKREFLSSTAAAPAAPPATVPAPTAGNQTPGFAVGTGDPTRPTYVIAGGGAGGVPLVRVLDYSTGVEKFRFLAYEVGYTGGVRTAVGDVTGDGVPDVLVATGLGGGPRVRVFDGTDGGVLRDFFAYEETFRGGLFLAVGDVNGDGVGDIVTGTEVGGGPRVQAFDARTGATLLNFFAFDAGQRGGVRVASADFNADGRADVVATTGVGVETRVRVIDAASGSVLADYAPYESAYTGGVYAAAADFDGDGTPDVVVGADSGGGPRVQVFRGLTQTALAGFFAFDANDRGGARVAARDVTGDGKADLVVSTGSVGRSAVRVFRSPDLQPVEAFDFTADDLAAGAYVG